MVAVVDPVVVFVIVEIDTRSGGGFIDDEVASSVGVFVSLFLFELFIVLRLLMILVTGAVLALFLISALLFCSCVSG